MGFKFDKEYNQYWKSRIDNASDGTKVPGLNVLREIIEDLKIASSDRVLDLGCGQGRMFPEINRFTEKIYGIDIDLSMIDDAASLYNYRSLHRAYAEDTGYPSNYFDKIIMLGTFDVVEQEKCLVEINRILKTEGQCLITGKNNVYCKDDEKAFIAERNAKLKNFPNHFTDVKKLMENLSIWGYSCEELNVFIRRGDFGEGKKVKIDKLWIPEFYEYGMVLKKISESISTEMHFADEFSQTAMAFAKEQNETDMLLFFYKSRG